MGETPIMLRDFFDEPLESSTFAPETQGRITVELEGTPKYLCFPGLNGEACRSLLKEAQPR